MNRNFTPIDTQKILNSNKDSNKFLIFANITLLLLIVAIPIIGYRGDIIINTQQKAKEKLNYGTEISQPQLTESNFTNTTTIPTPTLAMIENLENNNISSSTPTTTSDVFASPSPTISVQQEELSTQTKTD